MKPLLLIFVITALVSACNYTTETEHVPLVEDKEQIEEEIQELDSSNYILLIEREHDTLQFEFYRKYAMDFGLYLDSIAFDGFSPTDWVDGKIQNVRECPELFEVRYAHVKRSYGGSPRFENYFLTASGTKGGDLNIEGLADFGIVMSSLPMKSIMTLRLYFHKIEPDLEIKELKFNNQSVKSKSELWSKSDICLR